MVFLYIHLIIIPPVSPTHSIQIFSNLIHFFQQKFETIEHPLYLGGFMRSWRQVKNKWTKTSPSDYLKLVRKHKYKHSLISTYMSRYFPMNANPPSLPFSCRNIFLWLRTYPPRRFPINEKPNQSQMTFLCPLPSFFSVTSFFLFFLFSLFLTFPQYIKGIWRPCANFSASLPLASLHFRFRQSQ